jgi:hypothetical protein
MQPKARPTRRVPPRERAPANRRDFEKLRADRNEHRREERAEHRLSCRAKPQLRFGNARADCGTT